MEAGPTLDRALSEVARVRLTRLPTPLDHLPQLSEKLGPAIYLKRDDLTDLALGGDKPRKLEYELAFARQQGVTALVTCGSAQSNHARLTTAAARKLGMACAVVLSRDDYYQFQGNLLTVRLMGAAIHVVEATDHWDLETHAMKVCDQLRSEGHSPHYVPISGTTPRSCLGYVRAGLEMIDQFGDMGIQPSAIYTPFGTGGIFSGVLLALRERGLPSPVIGISVNRDEQACRENLNHWWTELCKLLDRDPAQPQEPTEIADSFIGQKYGDPTPAALDAIQLLAENEGILMDPVYSGKMLSGFVAHCQAERWTSEDTVVLLHSGGVPAIFAYQEALVSHLEKRSN